MIGTHARQNTYQRLGIAESWWLLLDVLDNAAWMKIERAVDALGSLDLLHLNNGSSCRASRLAAEDPRRVGELQAVLRQVGAAGVVRNHHLNARAAEAFIEQFRRAASPITRLENEKNLYKGALVRVYRWSERVQSAEGKIGWAAFGALYGASIYACSNWGNMLLSAPLAYVMSGMAGFIIEEMHLDVAKRAVGFGLCARFERAVFDAVVGETLVNVLEKVLYNVAVGTAALPQASGDDRGRAGWGGALHI